MTFTTDATEVSKVVACYIAGVFHAKEIPIKKKDLITMRHNIDEQLSKEPGVMELIAKGYDDLIKMPEQEKKEEEVKLEIVKP